MKGKYIQLAHHQHENHHIGDVDARITEVVPGAHKASADRDGYPHQDEIAEQSHWNVEGANLFKSCRRQRPPYRAYSPIEAPLLVQRCVGRQKQTHISTAESIYHRSRLGRSSFLRFTKIEVEP